MMRKLRPLLAWILCGQFLLTGCSPSRPFYFVEDGDLSHYVDVATDIEVPDVDEERLAEVEFAEAPFTLANPDNPEYWNLKLEDAMRHTLANSKTIRSLGGQVVQTPETLLRGADVAQTVYGPALTESNARFGVAQALAAFDTEFSTSMFWERNERPVNLFFPGLTAPVFQQDLGTFQAQLQKTDANGGTFAMRNNTTYEWNSNPSNRFASVYNSNMEVEARQPLLQGAGPMFTRIAGPGAIPGFNNGVLIARINTDIAIADFEQSIRNLVSDVEVAYWELYFAYRNLDAVKAGHDSALQTWRQVYAKFQVGQTGGEADKEAQAREQYWLFVSQVQSARANLFTVERRLRYIMGLSPTDCRLIRPIDEPTIAKVNFEWCNSHQESLCRAVELRRQKWRIKQRELELIAAKNYLLPRLDAVARYRWNGFGDDLINPNGDKVNPNGRGFDNAFQTLTGGEFQDWQLGAQFRMPLGFRRELSGVRNAEMQLARERVVHQDLELELSHALSEAFNNLERSYALAQTNFSRRNAAQNQVNAVRLAYEAGTALLDLLLDAQRRLADAESAYFRSLVDYNLAIRELHLRKGSLLEYNGVHLAEGPWPGKAYFDAENRARERDAAVFIDYGFTRPDVISRGGFSQEAGTGETTGGVEVPYTQGSPTLAEPLEEIPAGRAKPGADEDDDAPPAPLEDDEEPSRSGGQARTQFEGGPALSGRPYSGGQTRTAGGRSGPPRATRRREAGQVRLISESQPAQPTGNGSIRFQPTETKPDESRPRTPSAEADSSASGWQSVERPGAGE